MKNLALMTHVTVDEDEAPLSKLAYLLGTEPAPLITGAELHSRCMQAPGFRPPGPKHVLVLASTLHCKGQGQSPYRSSAIPCANEA